MKVIHVLLKDLKIMLKDKKAVGIMILMPILLTTILGFALKSAFINDGTVSNKIHIGIVKKYDLIQERQKFKDAFINMSLFQDMEKLDLAELERSVKDLDVEEFFFNDFLGSKEMHHLLNYEILTEEQALQKLQGNILSAVVILPENFIYDMYINFFTPFRNKVEIKVLNTSTRGFSGEIVEGIMNGFANRISAIIIGKNTYIATGMESNITPKQVFNDMQDFLEKLTEDLTKYSLDIKYSEVKSKDPVSSFAYYSAAMTVMFILFTAGYGGKLLLEEKENITYQRMLIAGASPKKILYGKFFTIFLFGLIQASVMLFFSSVFLKANWGNYLLTLMITISAVFSVAGLGILLAVITYISNSYKAAIVFQSVVINIMAALGGSFIPINVMPSFMRGLSNFTINGLALNAYLKVMQGSGFSEIIMNLLVLIIFGLVLTFIAGYIFVREKRWQNA